ncbi:hypothetical protein BC826DRAFT_281071 [Russula brevipes]|nr:hypothetical protein BC826DRAFT_281071 [Russula brevipes]
MAEECDTWVYKTGSALYSFPIVYSPPPIGSVRSSQVLVAPFPLVSHSIVGSQSFLMSTPLPLYPLPYTTRLPPDELYFDVETSRVAFRSGIDARDVFLGHRRCVVCGTTTSLNRCHIIRRTDAESWRLLKELGWISKVKQTPDLEPGMEC